MRWEYKIIAQQCPRLGDPHTREIDEGHVSRLNDLGAQGWELVSVIPNIQDDVMWSATYVFKREPGARSALGGSRDL